LQKKGPSCLLWGKSSAGKPHLVKHLSQLSFYEVVKTIRWHPVQTPWITLTLSINAITNHNDIIDFNILQKKGPSCLLWVKSSAGKPHIVKHLSQLSFYEVVKTIRWHPVQTPWITLTLSINAISNHMTSLIFNILQNKGPSHLLWVKSSAG
jgi:acyl-homoserine lactone acylase PvdQ